MASEASRRKPAARREEILELARATGFAGMKELAENLRVSEMTVRRDVAALVQAGQLRSVYGGVTVVGTEPGHGTDFQVRASINAEAKRAIGRAAAELLRPNSLVAFDNGTTTLEVVRMLDRSMPLGIVTDSLPLLNALNGHDEVDLTSLGGEFQRDLQAYAGPITLAGVEQIHVAQYFLTATAVRADGVYCANQYDALTKRALTRSADQVVLLADSSKFEQADAMMKVVALDEVDVLVTDIGISDEARELLDGTGIELVVARPGVAPESAAAAAS